MGREGDVMRAGEVLFVHPRCGTRHRPTEPCPKVVCEHVRGGPGLVQMCRLPDADERSVECSCCHLRGIVPKDDDLSEPMICPYCDREAVLVDD